MTQIELTADEWQRLRELGSGPAHFPLPDAVARKFEERGYATKEDHGFAITQLGQAAVERHFSRPGE